MGWSGGAGVCHLKLKQVYCGFSIIHRSLTVQFILICPTGEGLNLVIMKHGCVLYIVGLKQNLIFIFDRSYLNWLIVWIAKCQEINDECLSQCPRVELIQLFQSKTCWYAIYWNKRLQKLVNIHMWEAETRECWRFLMEMTWTINVLIKIVTGNFLSIN